MNQKQTTYHPVTSHAHQENLEQNFKQMKTHNHNPTSKQIDK